MRIYVNTHTRKKKNYYFQQVFLYEQKLEVIYELLMLIDF